MALLLPQETVEPAIPCELAGLPLPQHLQGVSIKPLLADAGAAWDRPAISTMNDGNHAVRTDRRRYIRYAGGGGELHDRHADPNEWTSLAAQPERAAIKTELAQHLPADHIPSDEPATATDTPKRKEKAKP